MKKDQKCIVELSDDSSKWREQAYQAVSSMSYLLVHPSHILSLLDGASYKKIQDYRLQKGKESLEDLQEFLESIS